MLQLLWKYGNENRRGIFYRGGLAAPLPDALSVPAIARLYGDSPAREKRKAWKKWKDGRKGGKSIAGKHALKPA